MVARRVRPAGLGFDPVPPVFVLALDAGLKRLKLSGTMEPYRISVDLPASSTRPATTIVFDSQGRNAVASAAFVCPADGVARNVYVCRLWDVESPNPGISIAGRPVGASLVGEVVELVKQRRHLPGSTTNEIKTPAMIFEKLREIRLRHGIDRSDPHDDGAAAFGREVADLLDT
jgi:hypothetical protein